MSISQEKMLQIIVKKVIAITLLFFMAVSQFSVPIMAMSVEINKFNNATTDADSLSVTLEEQFLEFYEAGESIKLNANIVGGSGKEELVYESSDENIASVDESRKCNMVIRRYPCPNNSKCKRK